MIFLSKHKIEYDRPGCIGCGTCPVLCPENWFMEEDGQAQFKKKEINENDFDSNMEAAKNCPVNVIHVLDEKGKKLI